MEYLGWTFIIIGGIMMALSAIFLLFQKTFMGKLHYASLGDGIGMTFILLGSILIMHDKLKGLLLLAIFLIISPMTTHIIGRAFYMRSE